MKRDIKAQMYTDKYLRKLLSMSIDLIIFMKNYKVQQIAEVLYNEETQDVEYNILFEFEIQKIIDGKLIGNFKKVNELKGRALEKIKLSEYEIEKAFAS